MIYQLTILVVSSVLLTLEIAFRQNYIMDAVIGTVLAWELTNIISNKIMTVKLSKDVEYIKDTLEEIKQKVKG